MNHVQAKNAWHEHNSAPVFKGQRRRVVEFSLKALNLYIAVAPPLQTVTK